MTYNIQNFSYVTSKLYDVILDIQNWEPFLKSFCLLTKSDVGHLIYGNAGNLESNFSVIYGADPLRLYDYMAVIDDDPRIPYALERPNLPFRDTDLPDVKAYRKSGVYNFFQNQGMENNINLYIPLNDEGESITFALFRKIGESQYISDDVEFLSNLIPHLKNVIKLQKEYFNAKNRVNPEAYLFEQFPIGIILCDHMGRIKFTNSTTKEIIKNESEINLKHNEFWTEDNTLNERIRKSILALAINEPLEKNVETSFIFERSNGRKPLSIKVSKLTSKIDTAPDKQREPTVVILLCDLEKNIETNTELLQRLFGLTTTEAQILNQIVSGRSISEAALRLNMAEGTARTHLKRIFSKTNTHRQNELVHLILSHPLWLL